MSCVGRLCKDYLYLYNSLPLIPTPPLIMAVNIGEAVGCLSHHNLPGSNKFAAAESAAVTCSVTRDSLRVCTSLTGSGPLDAGGLLGLVLGEHEIAAHG